MYCTYYGSMQEGKAEKEGIIYSCNELRGGWARQGWALGRHANIDSSSDMTSDYAVPCHLLRLW